MDYASMVEQLQKNHRRAWCQTLTGKKFHLLDGNAEDMAVEDMIAMSYINRYNGHAGWHTPLDKHSLMVACMLPRELFWNGLTHDIHETYLGDITTPVKRALRVLEGKAYSSLDRLEDQLIVKVAYKFKITQTDEIDKQVLVADLRACSTERDRFMGPEVESWNLDDYPPLGEFEYTIVTDRIEKLIAATEEWRIYDPNRTASKYTDSRFGKALYYLLKKREEDVDWLPPWD